MDVPSPGIVNVEDQNEEGLAQTGKFGSMSKWIDIAKMNMGGASTAIQKTPEKI